MEISVYESQLYKGHVAAVIFAPVTAATVFIAHNNKLLR